RRSSDLQVHVAQALLAPGAMVHAADVDLPDLAAPVARDRGDGVDVAGEQDAATRVGIPLGEAPPRLLDRGEDDFDVRRHTHAIEVLLPLAGADLVIHEDDERRIQRLAPADHDLPVDEPVVDAVERDAHAAGVRIARAPASAARLAASAGGTSRWKTKSSSIARFTPVTTARSTLPRAYRTAPVRHEPPGRSTNSTAGFPPIAAVRRSARARSSQPSLLTGNNASSTPAIAATAATRDWATAEWDTTMPRSGSLIVFLEILFHFGPLPHGADQALVEGLGRVHTAVAEQVVHRHDLADHGEVLARVQGHHDDRQAHVEQGRLPGVQSGAVVLATRLPVFQLHHDLDALLLAHGADPEQPLDVDQADPAD